MITLKFKLTGKETLNRNKQPVKPRASIRLSNVLRSCFETMPPIRGLNVHQIEDSDRHAGDPTRISVEYDSVCVWCGTMINRLIMDARAFYRCQIYTLVLI